MSSSILATTSPPIETITSFMCSFFVIFLGRHQPAMLDMLENELVTARKRIQEAYHIKEKPLCDSSK